MQALHHFGVSAHLAEAARVLRPGGVFAALAWGAVHAPARVMQAYAPVIKALDPYWESTRDWVIGGYCGLPVAGRRITLPNAAMRKRLSADQFETIIAGWSATRAAISDGAVLPDAGLSSRQRRNLGQFEICWPIVGQVFRV
jgi:SAM-dependent methyltransferase